MITKITKHINKLQQTNVLFSLKTKHTLIIKHSQSMFYFMSTHSKAIWDPNPHLPQQKAGAENAQSYQAAAGVAGGVDVGQPAVADLVASTLEYAHPGCVLCHGLLLHRQGWVGILHVLPARVGQGHLSQKTHTRQRLSTDTCHREHTHLSQRTHIPVTENTHTQCQRFSTDTCHR